MTSDQLLDHLRERADDVFPTVTAQEIAHAEKRLGFGLTTLHRRIYREVGNGGRFLQGFYGIPASTGGYYDRERSLIEMREMLVDEQLASQLPHVVPIVDLGCAQWILIDCDTDRALTMVSGDVYSPGFDFGVLVEKWLEGTMHDALFAPAPSVWSKNPFLNEPTEFKRFTPRGEKVFTFVFPE
jgi:hypothetical protein